MARNDDAEDKDSVPHAGDPSASVGSRIKHLRQKKKLSIQTLSRLAGVSAGMLSQVERDLANPSLKLLTKIQVALGTSAGSLFPGENDVAEGVPDPIFVRRKGKRPFCELDYLTKELLSDGAAQRLELMLLHLPPNGSSGPTPLTSPAEKGGLVLEGTISMSVDGVEASLTEGDSFTFDGRLPHAFRNIGGAPAQILWVVSNFPMERHL
ncbi:helix-turn-helix domain-containing protein [Pukyongiella litopenaei]|uniref:Cupin domain-containing protein n=1 Tax=Pukyongiella litopenaei TaxID=2605946 RepID=A0A5C2H4R5_9RHOB|nr:cupin domain-containing protein [Pukyongiella litopenaei]QEP30665.1 cupin domain-containing protein [Pukyongiella litopenaei]